MNKRLSIIVPCFNESECVSTFAKAIGDLNLGIQFEIVFVDDGSTDDTLAQIKMVRECNPNVGYVSFSRNFGKEAAILAGLRKSQGDMVVTMDADLQDPPSLLPEMIEAIEQGGFDCVATRRRDRKGEPRLRSLFSRMFYKLMGRFSEVELVDGARDYRLMTRRVVDAIISMPEVNRFTKGIYQWVGFKTKWISFGNTERVSGKTKWSFWNLFTYAVNGVLAFSTAPLQMASILGVCCSAISFIALLFVVVRQIICGDPVAGWPSLVCIVIFFSGVQLLFIGILGSYLAQTYREAKCRPLYFIREESK